MGELAGNLEIGYEDGIHPGNESKDEKQHADDAYGNVGCPFRKAGSTYSSCSHGLNF
jgi:hypothetical protein